MDDSAAHRSRLNQMIRSGCSPEAAHEWVWQLASDPDDEIRRLVAIAVSECLVRDWGKSGLAKMRILLSDECAAVRSAAAFACGSIRYTLDDPIRDPGILDALRSLASDPDDEVRCEAWEALGLAGDADALKQALGNCNASLDVVMHAKAYPRAEYVEPLRSQLAHWEGDPQDVEDAIEACSTATL